MMPSGKQVFPLHLKLDDIDIRDIAHNLGHICRYNGGTDDFYSVAEHSSLICDALGRDGADSIVQLQGLLHDSPEYIFGDMIRPMKNALLRECPAAMEFLKEKEAVAEDLIAKKFGLPRVFDPRIKQYDDRIVNDEKSFLFGTGKLWTHGGEPLMVDIKCWTPQEARRHFKFRFFRLWRELDREEGGPVW